MTDVIDPRSAIRLACALLAACTFACGSHGSPDGGPILDGGESLALEVAGNPNNVLSAAATVRWASNITQVYISVQTGGATQQKTPVQTTAGLSNPTTFPVLLLQADTSYTFQAVGTDATGATYLSNTAELTTDSLPTFADGGSPFPVWAVTDGGVATGGYTLLASLVSLSFAVTNTPDMVQIVDGTGATVWYYQASPPLEGDFQQQPDGTFTLALEDDTVSVPGLEESLTTYRQIDVLGNTLHTWKALDFTDAKQAGATIQIQATDDHDIRIQPNGDALLFGYVTENGDASGIVQDGTPGPIHATIVGDVLERVTAGGDVSFAWNSLDYLSIDNADPASTPINGSVVDLTHGNAIDVMDDGNYLISLRDLSQALKIDSTTGDVIWALGGKTGQFQGFTFVDDPFNGPSCQHAVRELQASSSGCIASCPSGETSCPNHCGNIIMFDNGDGYSPMASRAVEYALDTNAWTATLVWSASADPSLFSFIHGYSQRLLNGNTLLDFGMDHTIDEISPSGSVAWQLTDASAFDDGAVYGVYRAYRLPSLYSYAQGQ